MPPKKIPRRRSSNINRIWQERANEQPVYARYPDKKRNCPPAGSAIAKCDARKLKSTHVAQDSMIMLRWLLDKARINFGSAKGFREKYGGYRIDERGSNIIYTATAAYPYWSVRVRKDDRGQPVAVVAHDPSAKSDGFLPAGQYLKFTNSTYSRYHQKAENAMRAAVENMDAAATLLYNAIVARREQELVITLSEFSALVDYLTAAIKTISKADEWMFLQVTRYPANYPAIRMNYNGFTSEELFDVLEKLPIGSKNRAKEPLISSIDTQPLADIFQRFKQTYVRASRAWHTKFGLRGPAPELPGLEREVEIEIERPIERRGPRARLSGPSLIPSGTRSSRRPQAAPIDPIDFDIIDFELLPDELSEEGVPRHYYS